MALRVVEGIDGDEVVLQAWCSNCREWVMPKQDNVTCSWCGDATTRTPKGADVAIAEGLRCKIEGCSETAVDRLGPYGKLCATHKGEARAARGVAPKPGRSSAKSAVASGTAVGKVRALIPLARGVDSLRKKLANLPSGTEARSRFQEAARIAEQRPTPGNLDALQSAMRALKKDGSVKRERLEADLAHAERDLAAGAKEIAEA